MSDGTPFASDAPHRRAALDPTRSFLVQAPAGSGKTELLIQRYLALLARVEQPERIVAMTFTRKAAAEMRERVVRALREAAQDDVVGDPHRATTRTRARAALAADRALGWNLLAHPGRLAIQTIDAYCIGLAQQAPLLSRSSPATRFEENAEAWYRRAARGALRSARATDGDWRVLLAQLDNDAEQVVALLAALLPKRDRWLAWLTEGSGGLRERLEATLQQEITAELGVVRAAFPDDARAALARALRYAADNLRAGGNDDLAAALERCAVAEGLPSAHWQQRDDWRALADWLLVQDDPRIRKTMDARGGVPPKGFRGDSEARKREIVALLEALARVDGLADALQMARDLPPPRYDDDTWRVVAALLAILPRVAAELTLVFAADGVADFVQATLAALAALGTADAPSDLLLALDLRVEHLLIDEFQDTSDVQYELLARLTAGWTPGDGRTLFAVGDPMQSIYRFRDADVRLFLAAQDEGRIGDVPIECLSLARNFRAQGRLVDWVNAVFPSVLAARGDPWRGAVPFAPASPARPAEPEVPTLDLLPTPEQEAQTVVARIAAALAADAPEVAVLVRQRPDLAAILPALRRAGIEYAAVDLDPLGARQAVLDLAALTHAVLQPADRLATLAVLRAPWCGLTLADLLAVAARERPGLRTILVQRAELADLSADGRARLDRLAAALLPLWAGNTYLPLAERVRGAWLALGGPVCLDEAIDFESADRYFTLLRAHTVAGDVPDWNGFLAALDALRAAPAAGRTARVQVMTLHKAKGLEFDTVITPGLNRNPRGEGAELLRWRWRRNGLMLAPINARVGTSDAVHAYLGLLAVAEADHELGRLLYVGTTRARTRLHLTAVAEIVAGAAPTDPPQWKPPRARTPLARLWQPLRVEATVPVTRAEGPASPASATAPRLSRLPLAWRLPELPATLALIASSPERVAPPSPLFEWAHATAAAIGTVAHRLLAQVAREGLAAWSVARVERLAARVRSELVGEGVDAAGLAGAERDVLDAVRNVLGDPRGRWLFAPEHEDARNEWALAGVEDGAIVHIAIDRSFVADGVRWIVDFKTGRHQGADRDAFLDREVERYAAQLARYGRIVGHLDPRPIRLALYFPLVEGAWREWALPVTPAVP